MSKSLNRVSRASYRLSRASRDANAVSRSVATGSPWPGIRRLLNKWIGRNVGRKIYFQ